MLLLLLLLYHLYKRLAIQTADATCAFTHALVSTHALFPKTRYVFDSEFQACQRLLLESGRTAVYFSFSLKLEGTKRGAHSESRLAIWRHVYDKMGRSNPRKRIYSFSEGPTRKKVSTRKSALKIQLRGPPTWPRPSLVRKISCLAELTLNLPSRHGNVLRQHRGRRPDEAPARSRRRQGWPLRGSRTQSDHHHRRVQVLELRLRHRRRGRQLCGLQVRVSWVQLSIWTSTCCFSSSRVKLD